MHPPGYGSEKPGESSAMGARLYDQRDSKRENNQTENDDLGRLMPHMPSKNSIAVREHQRLTANVGRIPRTLFLPRPGRNLTGYTTQKGYYHWFLREAIRWTIVRSNDFSLRVMSKDRHGCWRLMPITYFPRRGDMQTVCIEWWKMPQVAARYRYNITEFPPLHSQLVELFNNYDFDPKDTDNYVFLAWRLTEYDPNSWFDVQRVRIRAVDCPDGCWTTFSS